MLVVGISGSPRKKGNSEKIIEIAMGYFAGYKIETKKILLSEVDIGPCQHCNGCLKENYCVKDQQANEVNAVLEKASGIIVASPVYFGSISGQLKCLIDKTRPLRLANFKLRGKIGVALATASDRNGGQESAIRDIHSWMLIQGMMIVGDNQHFGGTVCGQLDSDEYGLQTVRKAIESMNEALLRLK